MSTDTAALGSVSLLPRHLAVLLLACVATLFAGNHVAARLAFDEGTGLLLAVLVRSAVALVVLSALFLWQGKRVSLPAGSGYWQLLAGLMVAIQSLCLYSAVARIPVVVALLLMNTFPIQLALITWALGGPRPTLRAALIMAAILVGLVIVLDVPAWLASPETLGPEWLPGVAFGLGRAAPGNGAQRAGDERGAGRFAAAGLSGTGADALGRAAGRRGHRAGRNRGAQPLISLSCACIVGTAVPDWFVV
ncbi:EamA family transporter [Billgrantia lactosivorans]|uniref:EamA family transporter n=1 Tax=Billgrantia lactosivorans TaxID=2185141 RepID=UPI003BEF1C09